MIIWLEPKIIPITVPIEFLCSPDMISHRGTGSCPALCLPGGAMDIHLPGVQGFDPSPYVLIQPYVYIYV